MADLLSERTIDAVEEALAMTRANAKRQHRQRLPHAQCPPSVTRLFSHRFQNRFDFHDAGREE